MSRRKQSRPRHVDNDGVSLGVEANGLEFKDSALRKWDDGKGTDDTIVPLAKRNNNNNNDDIDNDDDDKSTEHDNGDEFCPSDEAPSPVGCNISACDKCGVCFSDISQFIAHKKLCGSRNRILMPYDPPVNGYLQGGYDFGRNSLDLSVGKDFSDGEYRDDKDDFESMDEEERSRIDNNEYEEGDEVKAKARRRPNEDERDHEEESRVRSQIRRDEGFMFGLQSVMANSVQSMRDRREDGHVDSMTRVERCNDSDKIDDGKDGRRKSFKPGDTDSSLFGGNSNVTLEPLAATSAAVAQCTDSLGPREPVPEQVNMFRTMLFQLQQQQMMQIQMIQQMRRQLIASGVNPNLLPADIDLSMMSSEGLASVGAAMSGLQSATASAAINREGGSSAMSSGYNISRSPSHASDSSPSHSDSSHKEGDPPSPPASPKSPVKDIDRLREGSQQIKDDKTSSIRDLAERYLCPTKPVPGSPYYKDHLSVPLTRNPLEILQEKTAASLSSLPLPLGLRTSTSIDIKPPSSSSLLNSSALFASSPSLSALQKETDALKPSPILPPMSIPMSAEDYKGYIQRGTILERSQYASDDPFFKHKCRFCHKVFGSDSALQIHVRSHTGERPFKCNICGNRFSTKGNLKVHFERHKAKYPHIKMDATPVPEHLDRQPHLMPSFSPTPIPPPVSLPPPVSRMSIPPIHHGPTSSHTSPHLHPPHPSPFHAGFGGSFMSSIGHGLPPFGLMPPPRESALPFPMPLSISLASSMSVPLSLPRDTLVRRESPSKPSIGSVETSVIQSPRKESPMASNLDPSPSDARRHGLIHHPNFNHLQFFNPPNNIDVHMKQNSGDLINSKTEDEHDIHDDHEKDQEDTESRRSRSRHESPDSRSPSPSTRKSFTTPVTSQARLSPSSPPPPISRPSSSHSPRQSPASVISWASLASSQSALLPSHHPIFPHHHLPPPFAGINLPLPGNPGSFHLPPPPLTPVLPMSSPRINGHSPFLPPPPPPPPLPQPQAHISPPPGESSMFRNSILPTKTIDPSENLEQYMEVQKSETSKLEALVKNIEQKITDPNQCIICHRVLSCKSALQMHYRIHTGERPFKCKICGRSFTTKGNLKTHMGVHRAKPALRMMHQCPVCHKQFTNVLVLQQHIRAHTGSMQHLPHLPLLPPHMDWTHRPPFGLGRHHPYLPPLHHDSRSLDFPRIPASPFRISPGHFPRKRSQSMDSESNKEKPIKKDADSKLDESNEMDDDVHSDEDISKDDHTSRSHSTHSEDSYDKLPAVSVKEEIPKENVCHSSLTLTTPDYESAFLPPAFGNTPFDAPLAALEERVKAIDSQLSQTSFEKFRNSMGLDSAYFPHSSSNLPKGEKSSEFESESTSQPESPVSGGDMPSFGHPLIGGYDRNTTTCDICLKTFGSKSALDVHYRSHASPKPFICDVCERHFSTRGNLKQHMMTHKIRDIPSSVFDNTSNDNNDMELSGKDNTEEDPDANDVANEDYPFEEDDCFDDEDDCLDSDMDDDPDDMHDDMHDGLHDDQSEEEDAISRSKSQEDFQEDNNNITDFQNHNGDERQETSEDESNINDSNAENKSNNATSVSKSGNQTSPTNRMSSPTSIPHQPPQATKLNSNTQENVKTANTPVHRTQTCGSSSSSSNNPNRGSPISRRPSSHKHQCMTCMKPFSSASALQIHTRTHTGDKPFKCTVCSKAFTTRGNLKVHMGTHMWNNSPSRRGRRMSIEPPFLLSHVKEPPFMPTGFPPRPPIDFFYQYPLPMMNGPDSKMNEISVIQNLGSGLPGLPPIPPHLMQGFLQKENAKLSMDIRTAVDSNPISESRKISEPSESRDNNLDRKIASGELDLSLKVPSGTEVSPSRSSSTPSSSLSLSVQPVTSAVSGTTSSTPSPSNNKENSGTSALDLRNMRSAPWLWGGFPCHHCNQMFPIQDSLEHHLRTHHIGKTETASHPLSKTESHPPPAPKALLA